MMIVMSTGSCLVSIVLKLVSNETAILYGQAFFGKEENCSLLNESTFKFLQK